MSVSSSQNSSETSKSLIETLKLNGSKYDNLQESRSLIAVYDQLLFIWHGYESCVLSVELGDKNVNDSNNFNILLPTNPPVFDVECISFNRLGTMLALIGHRGIMIMQMPLMSRKSNDSNSSFCRSWYLAEKFFVCSSRIKILQVAWHPGSLSSTHIVMLSSDNYLRLYDASDSQIPLQAVPLSSSDCISKSRASFSACFEENAVSFDFGPPESNDSPSKVLPSSSSNDNIYPVYVLHCNGDVYVVKMAIQKTNRCTATMEGPLPIHPPAEDNYGIDACSLICLHSNPPTLVIAMMSGIIYHGIVLDNVEDKNTYDRYFLNTNSGEEPKVALYIHGSVELPLLLSEELCDVYSQPVRLNKDVMSHCKYHCSLPCGVYTVIVPFIEKLEKWSNNDDIEDVMSEIKNNDCLVEHLLSTQPISTMKAIPVIGVAPTVSDSGLALICFLASWEFTYLPLLNTFHPMASSLLSTGIDSEAAENQTSNEKFGQQIKQLLCHSSNTPILKTSALANDKEGANTQQHLELVWSITNRFREEYIDRLGSAHTAIEHRANVLKQHKEVQLTQLERHLKEKDELHKKTEELAKKYRDACVNQQLLFERTEGVMKLLLRRFPILSLAEVAMKHELLEMEEKLKGFKTSLQQIKEKLDHQKKIAKDLEQDAEISQLEDSMKRVYVGETQLSHLKEILQQEGETISKLIKNVLNLKREHGM